MVDVVAATNISKDAAGVDGGGADPSWRGIAEA